MPDVTLRTIAAGERDAVLDLLAGWLDDRAFFARYFAHDSTFRDDLCFVAERGGRLISTLQVFRKRVRVGDAVLEVAALGNVYTDPAARTGGTASALLERALEALPAHGFDASLLFASKLDFYARFGWRTVLRHLTFIAAAPDDAPLPSGVETFDATRELAAVMAVYEAHSGRVAGGTQRDAAYWRGQLRYAGNPDECVLVARRAGRIVAYARAAVLYEFNAITEHGCLPGEEEALLDLLSHHIRAAGALPGTLAQLVPDVGLSEALTARGFVVRTVDDPSAMWRVIDAERLAAKLKLPVSRVQRDDFFCDLLPQAASRYWVADRF
ncbi:MAG: GNAT family N-acetyltransferase [bacterium]